MLVVDGTMWASWNVLDTSPRRKFTAARVIKPA